MADPLGQAQDRASRYGMANIETARQAGNLFDPVAKGFQFGHQIQRQAAQDDLDRQKFAEDVQTARIARGTELLKQRELQQKMVFYDSQLGLTAKKAQVELGIKEAELRAAQIEEEKFQIFKQREDWQMSRSAEEAPIFWKEGKPFRWRGTPGGAPVEEELPMDDPRVVAEELRQDAIRAETEEKRARAEELKTQAKWNERRQSLGSNGSMLNPGTLEKVEEETVTDLDQVETDLAKKDLSQEKRAELMVARDRLMEKLDLVRLAQKGVLLKSIEQGPTSAQDGGPKAVPPKAQAATPPAAATQPLPRALGGKSDEVMTAAFGGNAGQVQAIGDSIAGASKWLARKAGWGKAADPEPVDTSWMEALPRDATQGQVITHALVSQSPPVRAAISMLPFEEIGITPNEFPNAFGRYLDRVITTPGASRGNDAQTLLAKFIRALNDPDPDRRNAAIQTLRRYSAIK